MNSILHSSRKTNHPLLISTQFSQDEMCVICSPDSPLVKKKQISLDTLEGSEWALREPGSGSREFFLRTIAPRLEQWQESFQLNTTEALINSVAAGLGLSCLSRLSAQPTIQDGRVVELILPLDMKRRFWLLLHKRKISKPSTKVLY